MDTIKETAGKAKDWVVEHRWDIASAVVALGIGGVCGKMIGKEIGHAMADAYQQGFRGGCGAVALCLASENKDNPEVLGAVLKFTTENSK